MEAEDCYFLEEQEMEIINMVIANNIIYLRKIQSRVI